MGRYRGHVAREFQPCHSGALISEGVLFSHSLWLSYYILLRFVPAIWCDLSIRSSRWEEGKARRRVIVECPFLTAEGVYQVYPLLQKTARQFVTLSITCIVLVPEVCLTSCIRRISKHPRAAQEISSMWTRK